MSFTRFYDDECRMKKQLEQQTFLGRYQLDVPGNGNNMHFQEDPHIRLQKWGANFRNNIVNIESDLHGLTRPLNRDHINENNWKMNSLVSEPVFYNSHHSCVEETRASHPAWSYRNMPIDRWEDPITNPQANLETPFAKNIQTRILEKDFFVAGKPMVSPAPLFPL